MTEITGLLIIISSLFWFYYLYTKSYQSKHFKWYAVQRDILGGIILMLLGLYLFFNLNQ